jgi:hypothetical protein
MDTPLSDMTLLVIKLGRTFVTDSSATVSSSDIHARDKLSGSQLSKHWIGMNNMGVMITVYTW